MNSFQTRPSPSLIVGPGTLSQLPDAAQTLACRNLLLVTDSGIVAAGHVERATTLLVEKNIQVTVYEQTKENPTESDIEHCRQFAAQLGIDGLIGLGGGSSLDTAKGCNFLLADGGRMSQFKGYGLAKNPFLPFIAIPTTAGTGSECQSYAVVSSDEDHRKMACGDPKALAKVAILDPELTLSQPPRVATLTAIDALSHALESIVSTRRNPLSQTSARQSFHLLASSIQKILTNQASLADRSNLLLGAALAGLSIENSMLGAAHAAANPLTAHFDLAHGHAIALTLAPIVAWNHQNSDARSIYQELEAFLSQPLLTWLQETIALANLPNAASSGVTTDHLPQLASDAASQWTGQFNPHPLTTQDFQTLYQQILQPELAPSS